MVIVMCEYSVLQRFFLYMPTCTLSCWVQDRCAIGRLPQENSNRKRVVSPLKNPLGKTGGYRVSNAQKTSQELHRIALHCIVLNCIVCIALYCIVLHCIVLHCI